MAKYRVWATITSKVTFDIEAPSLKCAIEHFEDEYDTAASRDYVHELDWSIEPTSIEKDQEKDV